MPNPETKPAAAPDVQSRSECLTTSEREQIATILSRRANEIAGYCNDNRGKLLASVDYGLELEMRRLRRLAARVSPPQVQSDEEP